MFRRLTFRPLPVISCPLPSLRCMGCLPVRQRSVERRTADSERNKIRSASTGSLLPCTTNRPELLADEGDGRLTTEGPRSNLGKALVQIRLQQVDVGGRHNLLKAPAAVDGDRRKQFFLPDQNGAQPDHLQ